MLAEAVETRVTRKNPALLLPIPERTNSVCARFVWLPPLLKIVMWLEADGRRIGMCIKRN